MMMLNKNILISMTRSFFIGGLVFLCLCCSCKNPDASEVTIEWKGKKATGIIIPGHLLGNFDRTNIGEQVTVTLRGSDVSILGEFEVLEREVLFRPLIPFTRGNAYEIKKRGQLLAGFVINMPGKDYVADVRSVWPLADTLPENLLKFYISFSQPMQQGNVLQHIRLVKDGKDTLKDVFLDLQQELWSNDNLTLTLWLDPGRIKRDLQPNKLLGPPMQAGHQYTLMIDSNWMTADGVRLQSSFYKHFYTKGRDDISPDISKWDFATASGESPLVILNLREAMDGKLLPQAIRVFTEDSVEIEGQHGFLRGDSIYVFQPVNPLPKGNYFIRVDPKLEDIAGNNLLHPFDNDLLKKSPGKVVTERSFTIKGKN
jgi:hypothetical protein